MFVATDLHGHTHLSDGRATPEEYGEVRRALGMKAIAIAEERLGATGATRLGAPPFPRTLLAF